MPRQISCGDAPLSVEGGRSQLVWDLPVRLFHWLLAALIVFSWWSVHHHHTDWHIWSGCAILTLLIFRILWGFFGSSTSRFTGFVRGPRAVGAYLRGEWFGIGHNPLGALSVLALLAAVAVQVALGLVAQDEDGIYMGPLARLVTSDQSDKARALHSAWFNVLLGLIVLHLAAIAFYKVRGIGLTRAMISGKTDLGANLPPMRAGKWWAALICLAIAIAITRWVIAGAPHVAS
ncbi:MAG TPA: cytochrome b/b6 domain-containing protein [Sphingomicrobium sp.]|nr:cytochrome b/b6 domain-containing protein [Sphingomicrobium sp.]